MCLVLALAAAVSQAAAAQRVHVSESVAESLLSEKVDPQYPPSARSAKVQGTVVLKVEISKTGIVEDVSLVSGQPPLASAATQAVKQWKYKPYMLNGAPVAIETTVRVKFAVDEGAPPGSEGGVLGAIPAGVPSDQAVIGGIIASAPPPTPHIAPPSRVPVSGAALQALLISSVPPQYPREAKAQGIEGRVVLRVVIGRDGRVIKAEAVSGPALLIPPAVDAVRQWKYKPFLLNQKPVEVQSMISFDFTLRGH